MKKWVRIAGGFFIATTVIFNTGCSAGKMLSKAASSRVAKKALQHVDEIVDVAGVMVDVAGQTSSTVPNTPKIDGKAGKRSAIAAGIAAMSAGATVLSEAPQRNVPSDLGLGGICIGYSKNNVYDLIGKETNVTDPDKTGHLRYQYPDIEVVITNGIVTGFVSETSAVQTKRGIHQGSTLQEVIVAYGNNYSQFDYEGMTLYEYPMNSMNHKKCLMRFAIKNNRVDYISARVLD